MSVVTRIAPSPTGYMHIGTARTGLYNYLFARRHGGKFLLRVEDTDKERSTKEAEEAIYDGMKWLGLEWDDDAISQASRVDRHAEIAKELLAKGAAYKCYLSKEELETLRNEARTNGKAIVSPWRDKDPSEAPQGIAPVIRIKAPIDGETTIEDAVQGHVTVKNSQLDDFILLRADGTPTYMLAVVVDDHDMGVTHIIRGDDHLNNTFRQNIIYNAMGWDIPVYAHISLIHGEDGKKMSKRHGATGVREFRDMGYLPEAMRNYLLRLGWSHGDDEIISDQQAIDWFNLESLNKSAARFDYARLDSLNAHYIRQKDDTELVDIIKPILEEKLRSNLEKSDINLLKNAMEALKERAKTTLQLADSAMFYVHPLPLPMEEKAQNALNQEQAPAVLQETLYALESLESLTPDTAHDIIGQIMEKLDLKMGKIGPVIRAALCGTMNAPDLKLVMATLGKERCLERIMNVMN